VNLASFLPGVVVQRTRHGTPLTRRPPTQARVVFAFSQALSSRQEPHSLRASISVAHCSLTHRRPSLRSTEASTPTPSQRRRADPSALRPRGLIVRTYPPWRGSGWLAAFETAALVVSSADALLLVSETSAAPGRTAENGCHRGPRCDERAPEGSEAQLVSCSEEPERPPGPRLPSVPRLLANGRKGLSRPHTDRVARPRCYGRPSLVAAAKPLDRGRRPRGLASTTGPPAWRAAGLWAGSADTEIPVDS
jgi:hypothetical protein